jgi:hypothetical protein
MGMRGRVRQITPAELQNFQHNPEAVEEAVHGKAKANAPNMKAALERVQQLAMQARASGATADPAEQEKVRAEILKQLAMAGGGFQDQPDEEGLNLEKSWHVLHYLLTGQAEEAPAPLGNAILGGKEIGGDLGYGPARLLTPQEVREVAAALSAITEEDLANRFDLDAMMKANIYPCKDDSELELAQHYFGQLSRYYADAAASGNSMLLYIV